MTERRRLVLVDARKARDFGIGTYIRGLLGGLARLDRFALQALVLPGDEALFPPGVTTTVCASAHYSFGELVAVRRAISAAKPDLFHAPHYVVPFFPPRATVVTIHDLMHLSRPEHRAPAKRAYARWMMGRALRLSARVIAVSEATKKEILAFGPSLRLKVEVVPNGVEEKFFLEGKDRNGSARRVPAALSSILPFEESSSYILFLGNDKPHKNLDGLLAAWPRLLAAHPDLSLVLAGVEPGRTLPQGAKAVGWVPEKDVPRLVAGARALVLPSFAEGFGLPVLEAQAAGTPVACSDLPALREAAGDAAVFFDPHDVTSIAEALGVLLGDEEKKEFLRKRGRERAAQFTWTRTAERTAGIYDSVLHPFKEKTPAPEPGRDSSREEAKDLPS
ncbi:MAG: glycosyltransferase family 4 protein [Thermoanaerobaculia bacterium]